MLKHIKICHNWNEFQTEFQRTSITQHKFLTLQMSTQNSSHWITYFFIDAWFLIMRRSFKYMLSRQTNSQQNQNLTKSIYPSESMHEHYKKKEFTKTRLNTGCCMNTTVIKLSIDKFPTIKGDSYVTERKINS